MRDFVIRDGILEKYNGSDSIVEIPSGVVEIGVGAFSKNSSLKKVIIPEGVRYIRAAAFRECVILEEVLFPTTLETIGASAFYFCRQLKKVTLPPSTKTIGASAFGGCFVLERVVLPSNIKLEDPRVDIRPADGIFNRCDSLKSAGPIGSGCNIEYGWTDEIPFIAFYGSSLSRVIISDSIRSVQSLAFKRCGGGLQVSLPSSCNIGRDVFDDDTNIRFSNKISSKDKISAELAKYVDQSFCNSLTTEELAWLLLYQSKKWKIAILNCLRGQRALDVLDSCYVVLDNTKKMTKAVGLTLVDLLNQATGSTAYMNAAKALNDYLLQRKCNDAAALLCVEPALVTLEEKETDKDVTSVHLFKNVSLGDEISFGSYPQRRNSESEPIKWIVLMKEERRLFLVSKDSLAIRKYHDVRKKISWARCDLRQWLNNEFLQQAFSEAEQKVIDSVNKDKVTLLTKDDINLYFTDIKLIAPRLTEYACADDPKLTENSPCAWWLRLPIGSESKAPFVWGVDLNYVRIEADDFAQFMNTEYQVNNAFAVRPAIWLSLK